MQKSVGFIGLGNIGKPMASHLAPAGFAAYIFDIDDGPVQELVAGGATAAKSPRQLAERAEIIGICVPNDEHVRSVVVGENGILAGAARGTTVLIHSTVQPQTVEELAAAAAERGVTLIDAAVTGGDERAAKGVLTYLVGGDDAVVERIRYFLEPSSETIIAAGKLGDGARLKLAINTLTYIQWAAAAESYRLAAAAGVDPQVFVRAGRANGQLSELQERYLILHSLPEKVIADEGLQRVNGRHMHTAEKDLTWALDLARKSGVSLPVAGLVSQLMASLYRVQDPGRRR